MWSIGCLFAELAINEPLFNGETEIEQLFKIFRFCGAPQNWVQISNDINQKVQFPMWTSTYFGYASYPKTSWQFKALAKAYLPHRERAFYKLMKLKNVIGLDGLDLLQKLLNLNPQERYTAQEAMKHPFFESLQMNPQNESTIFSNEKHYNLEYPVFNSIPHLYSSCIQIEKRNKIDKNYISRQTSITENMRAILVDWLIDVSVHFEVSPQTLHYAIHYIDRTLSKINIEKNKLQLV
jgi:serine/threonine protein kinase